MSRLLLDTHCWLWLQTEPERFAPDLLRELGDPFDRLLVAQAQLEGLAILSADPLLSSYDVELRTPF